MWLVSLSSFIIQGRITHSKNWAKLEPRTSIELEPRVGIVNSMPTQALRLKLGRQGCQEAHYFGPFPKWWVVIMVSRELYRPPPFNNYHNLWKIIVTSKVEFLIFTKMPLANVGMLDKPNSTYNASTLVPNPLTTPPCKECGSLVKFVVSEAWNSGQILACHCDMVNFRQSTEWFRALRLPLP